MADAYNGIIQERTPIVAPNTWVAINVPVGSRNALLGVESDDATIRISYDNTVNAETEGMYIPGGGYYYMEGVNSIQLTIYISCSVVTTAILQYTNE